MEPVFVGGILIGAMIAAFGIPDPNPILVHPELVNELKDYGITDYSSMVPTELVSWDSFLSPRISDDDRWWLFSGLWFPLCRWLYQWSCHHGFS